MGQELGTELQGDTLISSRLDRLARSVPDARAIADQLQKRGIKLALDPTLYDPNDPMGKMFFNILAAFADFEAGLILMRPARAWPSPAPGGNCAASSPTVYRALRPPPFPSAYDPAPTGIDLD